MSFCKGEFKSYIEHLYFKYKDNMTYYDANCVFDGGCISENLGACMTAEEEARCAELWERDYERGLVD